MKLDDSRVDPSTSVNKNVATPEGAAAVAASPHPRIDDPAHPWVPTLAAIRTVDALGGRGHAEA
jgi:hypothetical protein